MELHLEHLLSRSWRVAFDIGDSNNVNVIYLSIGAILLTFALTIFREWWKGGRTVTAFRKVWVQWPTYLIPVFAIVLLWGGLYCWAIVKTIYIDHRDLTIAASRKCSTQTNQLSTQTISSTRTAQAGKHERLAQPNPVQTTSSAQSAPATITNPIGNVVPTNPQIAARVVSKSAYKEVGAALEAVSDLNGEWSHDTQDCARVLERTHGNERPSDIQAAKDSFFEQMVRIIYGYDLRWQKIRLQVDAAFNHAIDLMGSPGPHQMTPRQLDIERKKYGEASPGKHVTDDAELHQGRVNQEQYQPLSVYLNALHEKLADYPENSMPQ